MVRDGDIHLRGQIRVGRGTPSRTPQVGDSLDEVGELFLNPRRRGLIPLTEGTTRSSVGENRVLY